MHISGHASMCMRHIFKWPGQHVYKPANGLDNNGFNNLDFVLGLFRLGAKWASVKTNWFGLGSSTQQFGANWVPI